MKEKADAHIWQFSTSISGIQNTANLADIQAISKQSILNFKASVFVNSVPAGTSEFCNSKACRNFVW